MYYDILEGLIEDHHAYSYSYSLTGRLKSLIARGVYAERANTYVPLSQPYIMSKIYFTTGQQSVSLNEICFSRLYKVLSATLIIFGFCLSKPINPSFINSIPAIFP